MSTLRAKILVVTYSNVEILGGSVIVEADSATEGGVLLLLWRDALSIKIYVVSVSDTGAVTTLPRETRSTWVPILTATVVASIEVASYCLSVMRAIL